MKRAHQRLFIAVGLVPRYLRASVTSAGQPNVGLALNCEIGENVRSAPLSSLRKFATRVARARAIGLFFATGLPEIFLVIATILFCGLE